MTPDFERDLLVEVERLGPAEQRQVLDFARALGSHHPPDSSGKGILCLAGAFDAPDLAEIAAAIEESCEGVDLDDW